MTAALAAVPEPAKRAAIYCRLSLDKDGTAESVADQETEGRELCERRGWHVAEILTDNDLSAYNGAKRPGYDRLVDLVQRCAVDVVVARRPDRLQRSSIGWGLFLRDCQRGHVLIATVQEGDVDLDTPEGEFMAQIAGNLAQLESARIGKRMRARHLVNAQRGKAHGGVRSYGYRRVKGSPGELEVVPAEAAMIVEACDRILRGETLMAIVGDWNDRGIPTTKGEGSVWRPGTLSKVLRSARIAGLREGKALNDLQPGIWEPILPVERWQLLRRRITGQPVGRRPRRHLLAGICVCAECDKKMVIESDRVGKPGRERRSIACDKAHMRGCGSCSAAYAHVEKRVLAYLTKWMQATNITQARAKYTTGANGHLQAEIAKDRQLLDEYKADAVRNRMGPAEYLDITESIRTRLEDNERQLDQVAQDSDLADADFEGVSPETFAELELETQRKVLRVYVAEVRIHKGKRGRSFDPNRVDVVPTKVVPAVSDARP